MLLFTIQRIFFLAFYHNELKGIPLPHILCRWSTDWALIWRQAASCWHCLPYYLASEWCSTATESFIISSTGWTICVLFFAWSSFLLASGCMPTGDRRSTRKRFRLWSIREKLQVWYWMFTTFYISASSHCLWLRLFFFTGGFSCQGVK